MVGRLVEPGRLPQADEGPVYGVFLLVAPLDRRDQHYEVLGRVAALGADKARQLRGCRTAAEVHDLLKEFDRR